ncbi:MAG: polyribonucleotide nucleotidyltransferase [candidate division WOR-3 bacterium]|nr:MAG: polyribonucleotide nucleotidyltransferase [candidate division WOR-3 bacterium]
MHSVSLRVGEKQLSLETGRVAKQAAAECTVSYGDTILLVAVSYKPDPSEGIDFLPLTVDYRELSFAAGKIPGGFFKRESRPSESEILISRLIDRSLRPLFPKGFRNEVQIITNLLSSDVEHEPDAFGIIGAATALLMSELPFATAIAAVKVGMIDGQYVINPTLAQQTDSKLDVIVAGTRDSVVMIEGGAKEASEEEIIKAIQLAQPEISRIIDIEEEMVKNAGREKITMTNPFVVDALYGDIKDAIGDSISQILQLKDKKAREDSAYQLIKTVAEKLMDKYDDVEPKVKYVVDDLMRSEMRERVIRENKRLDGRGLEDIRPVSCEIGLLPRTHGSALFTRGQTQSLAVTTLGTASDEQRIDDIYGEESKSFMLHYNFPPFSTGDVRPMRGPGRREIGHGALAERAISPVLPKETEFPYTVRVVSNILESNGSSSMASVCGSSLALMDAGVPIKAPVSGISVGLVTENGQYVLLTDILGTEDHYGDMDFKVAGTADGVTAIQLDLKIQGLPVDVLAEAMQTARTARLEILKVMNSTISTPRSQLSKYAPKIVVFSIAKEKIGEVIGPGGKVIRKIIADNDVEIDIDDDGKVTIAGEDRHNVEKAQETVQSIVQEAEVGKLYVGKVKRIMTFGAFVEILPGKEGLVHISKLSRQRVKRVEDVVKIGDEIVVKVANIDDQGRINLIRKE